MASTINATTSSGIVATADNTGNLALQSAGSTIATVSSTGLAVTGTITATGSLAGNGPSFRASKSSTQAISTSTWTKVQYTVEDWDTNSNYDNSTNYRFTPTVAGYYQVDMAVEFNNVSGNSLCAIYKNGTNYITSAFYAGSTGGSTPSAHALIYMNGSTDYIEGYGYTGVASQSFYNGPATYFNAFLARSA